MHVGNYLLAKDDAAESTDEDEEIALQAANGDRNTHRAKQRPGRLRGPDRHLISGRGRLRCIDEREIELDRIALANELIRDDRIRQGDRPGRR